MVASNPKGVKMSAGNEREFIDYLQNKERRACPECGTQLEYFSGLEQIPEYFYCPKCMDKAYNLEGEVLFGLE